MAAVPVAVGIAGEAKPTVNFALDFGFFGGFRSILFGRSVQFYPVNTNNIAQDNGLLSAFGKKSIFFHFFF